MLKKITQPTLLINGEHDVEGFIRIADEREASLPNAKRATIPGAGGFPLWEYPAKVNALVKQFLG